MKASLVKLFVLASVLVLAVIIVGGINTTSADVSAQGKPPTVALPTRVGTKPPTLTATPTKPGVAPKVATATPIAPLKGATPTKVGVRGGRSIPGPSGSFSSAFTIQNMSASTANCNYIIYNASGGVAYTSASFQIPVGGSNFTYVPNIGGLASGQYSAVINCDQQVAAVSNFASANSAASYRGIDAGIAATVWYAPNAFNNYYNFDTNFVVQNATGGPVNVTVEIINASGSVVATQTQNNVPAYSYANFEQTGLAGMNANTSYSAKISATGNIAVVANIFGRDGTSAANQMYSYTPFTSGPTVLYAPVIMKNYYGFVTALTVQNIGTTATTVRVTYGTGLTEQQSINANASHVFYTPNSALPNGTLTSAKIESLGGQPIVALVNEANNYGRAATYTAFSEGSLTVRAPIILKRYYNFNTSITCQNIGNVSTNITVTYSNGSATVQNNIPANGTALFYQPNESSLPNGFNGSATITSSSQPIVCIINENQSEPPYSTTVFDQLLAYEGLKQ